MAYQIEQEFILNQDIDWTINHVSIEAKRDTFIKIVGANATEDFPYLVYFVDCKKCLQMSADELDSICQPALAEY